MDKETLKQKIISLAPEAVFEVSDGLLHVIIDGSKSHQLLEKLMADKDTDFAYLTCLTAVDWKQFFYVVYFLRSFQYNHEVVVKAKISEREHPQTDSVCDLWKGAEVLEREVYDFFGIKFNNHPDLKRIFLDEEWKGFPLRKDYVDEVNIVEL